MKLYLVRHAEAIERTATTPDGSRYLTPAGRLSFRKIARRAREEGAAPDVNSLPASTFRPSVSCWPPRDIPRRWPSWATSRTWATSPPP
jgi:hypothetical protein